jgi:DNA adenine methylase
MVSSSIMKANGQYVLIPEAAERVSSFETGQLLKWIGNKHRFAAEIVSFFPKQFTTYREPFLGSGAVLGTLAPDRAVGSDSFKPLMEIWTFLHSSPEYLKSAYETRWRAVMAGEKVEGYERIKANYNARPNGEDLLFLSRSCYGGVVRFRKADGYMSTPCGIHRPMSPKAFALRVDEWHKRTAGCAFATQSYEESMKQAGKGDLIYCDPPYTFTQSILYGAQSFDLAHLFEIIRECRNRGVNIALSIDGTKRSGDMICDIKIPSDLFEREVLIHCGRSMLKRFQMHGLTLEREVVHDRLLLTY